MELSKKGMSGFLSNLYIMLDYMLTKSTAILKAALVVTFILSTVFISVINNFANLHTPLILIANFSDFLGLYMLILSLSTLY